MSRRFCRQGDGRDPRRAGHRRTVPNAPPPKGPGAVVHRSPHRDEVGQYFVDQGITKVFTVASHNAAGQQMIAALGNALTAAAARSLGRVHALPEEPELRPYLAKAKSSGAQAVHAFNAGGKAISFVEQYDSFGMKEACRCMARAS